MVSFPLDLLGRITKDLVEDNQLLNYSSLPSSRIKQSAPFVIGISGPAGAGKSTLADQLKNFLNKSNLLSIQPSKPDAIHPNQLMIEIISTDCFLKTNTEMAQLNRLKGEPASFDAMAIDRFIHDVKNQLPTSLPSYFHQHGEKSHHDSIDIKPNLDILIIEGLNLYTYAPLFKLIDYNIYIVSKSQTLISHILARSKNLLATYPSSPFAIKFKEIQANRDHAFSIDDYVRYNWFMINKKTALMNAPTWSAFPDIILNKRDRYKYINIKKMSKFRSIINKVTFLIYLRILFY